MKTAVIATCNETGMLLKMTPQPAYHGKRFTFELVRGISNATKFTGEGQFKHQCEEAGVDPANFHTERTYV